MAERSLSERIINILEFANRPLTAAEIRRRLPDDIEAAEVSSCIVKMVGRNEIKYTKVPRRAKTGPLEVKAYDLSPNLNKSL